MRKLVFILGYNTRMRIPYAVQGMICAPAIVGLIFILKAFCPANAGGACFADAFATPVFLPLVAMYRIFGHVPDPNGQEVLFVFLYWAAIGFLIGLACDMWLPKKEVPSI